MIEQKYSVQYLDASKCQRSLLVLWVHIFPGASLDGDRVGTMETDFRDISLNWKAQYELRVARVESEVVYTSISA